MTMWSEQLPDENGYYWVWTGTNLKVGKLDIHPEGPIKSLSICRGEKAPVFNGRLFNGWQIGDHIENPEAPQC